MEAGVSKDKSGMHQGLQLRLLTGESVPLARGEFLRIAVHPLLLAFYGLIVLFILIANSNGQRDALPLALRLFGYGMSVAVGVGTLFLSVTIARRVSLWRTGRAVVYFPAALLVTITASVLWGEFMTPALYGEPRATAAQIALKLLFYIPIVEIAAAVVMYVTLPRILGSLRGVSYRGMAGLIAEQAAERAKERARLKVGEMDIDPDRLIRLEVEADLIRVITEDGTRIASGPLTQVLQALPEGMGTLVHRSDWVAARAVVGTTRIGRSRALRLVNGDVVRIASSRDAEVVKWLQERGLG